jgi:hypothetical protein
VSAVKAVEHIVLLSGARLYARPLELELELAFDAEPQTYTTPHRV